MSNCSDSTPCCSDKVQPFHHVNFLMIIINLKDMTAQNKTVIIHLLTPRISFMFAPSLSIRQNETQENLSLLSHNMPYFDIHSIIPNLPYLQVLSNSALLNPKSRTPETFTSPVKINVTKTTHITSQYCVDQGEHERTRKPIPRIYRREHYEFGEQATIRGMKPLCIFASSNHFPSILNLIQHILASTYIIGGSGMVLHSYSTLL